MNAYLYCYNDGINYFDASGAKPEVVRNNITVDSGAGGSYAVRSAKEQAEQARKNAARLATKPTNRERILLDNPEEAAKLRYMEYYRDVPKVGGRSPWRDSLDGACISDNSKRSLKVIGDHLYKILIENEKFDTGRATNGIFTIRATVSEIIDTRWFENESIIERYTIVNPNDPEYVTKGYKGLGIDLSTTYNLKNPLMNQGNVMVEIDISDYESISIGVSASFEEAVIVLQHSSSLLYYTETRTVEIGSNPIVILMAYAMIKNGDLSILTEWGNKWRESFPGSYTPYPPPPAPVPAG